MLLTMMKGSILLLASAGIVFVPLNHQTAVAQDFGKLERGPEQTASPTPIPKPKPKPPSRPPPPDGYAPDKGGHAKYGAYTVLEYPANKEVTLTLDPVNTPGAKGAATILRDDVGTRIKLNLSNVPADVSRMTLYAVDDRGDVTALGPIAISNGAGTLTTTTPLTKFMLIASAEAALTAYDANTKVFFRSSVPEGFAVTPLRAPASGERVAATGQISTSTRETYSAPLLNISAFKKSDDTKIKVDFAGALNGARANVFITPRKDGPTEITMRFHDLKEAPAGRKFVLWAVGTDATYQRLGEIAKTGGRNEAEIKSETTFPDFGLLITMETESRSFPIGPQVAVVLVVP